MNVNNLILALSVETQPVSSSTPASGADNSFADLLGGIQNKLGEIAGPSADATSHGTGTDKPAEETSSDVTQQPGPFGEGEVMALIGLPIVTQDPAIPADTAEAGDLGAESDSTLVSGTHTSDFSASAPHEQTVVFTQDPTVADSHETPQAAPTAPASEVTRAESTAVTPERSQAVFSFVAPSDTQETPQTDTRQTLPFGMTEPLPKTNEDGMTVQMTPLEELPDDILADMLARISEGELQGDFADQIRAILARRADEAQAAGQQTAETPFSDVTPTTDITPPERTQQAPETAVDHRDEAAPDSKSVTAQQPDPAIAQTASADTQSAFEPILEATTHVSQVPKQLSDFIVGAQGSDNFTLRMKLQPEGMGELHVKVQFEKGEVSLQVLASSEAAGDMLRQGGQELSQNLEQRGFLLQSLDIGLSGDGGQQQREQSFNNYFTGYAHDAADDIVVIPEAYAAAVRSQGMYYTA